MINQSKYINENAFSDEAIFISRDSTSGKDSGIFLSDYLLTYFCDRNLMFANGENDAVIIAGKLGKPKGIYFELNADTSLCKSSRFITKK